MSTHDRRTNRLYCYKRRNGAPGTRLVTKIGSRTCRTDAAALRDGDLLIFCADHGCDPTTPSTDHSREYTPLLSFAPSGRRGVDLGTRATLSDIGQTVAQNFETSIPRGESFLEAIS